MKTIFTRMSLQARIFMVLLVMICLVHFLQLWAFEIANDWLARKNQQKPTYPSDPARREVHYLVNGDVHLVRSTGEKDPNTGHDILAIYDADNVLMGHRSGDDYRDKTHLNFVSKLGFDRESIDGFYSLVYGFSRTLELTVPKGGKAGEIWRYDRNRQIFVGYDRSGQELGCLGKNGWQAGLSQAEGLGEVVKYHSYGRDNDRRLKVLWQTSECLYEIDAKARSVELLVDAKGGEVSDLRLMAWFSDADETIDPNLYRPLLVCQVKDHDYRLILREPKQAISLVLPETGEGMYRHCQFTATRERLYMKRSWVDFAAPPKDPLSPQWQQWYQDYCTTRKSHHDDLFQVDDQGQLKQLYAFNWMETQDWPQMVQWERHLLVWQRWINQTSPGLYAWIGNVVGYQKIWDFGKDLSEPWKSTVGYLFRHRFRPWEGLPLAILLIPLAYWHGRKRWTTRRQAWSWLVLILMFNVAGYLTYLALNHTPLVTCTACGKKRGLRQDACPYCQAPLPQPVHSRPHLVLS